MTIAYLDTETLGLDADVHPVWEIGLIVDGQEYCWQLPVSDRALALADPKALEVTRYHERTLDKRTLSPSHRLAYTEQTLRALVQIVGGRHLVGAIPSFDEERLRRLLWRHGLSPRWHYHIVDVEALAIGYLAAQGTVIVPPWKSDQLTEALGITIPEQDKHTALGDCRWAKAVWDRVMGGGS